MGIKLTIVNSLIVRNSDIQKLTTFSNNKMVCNKITFVFVLVGLISISCMVSSAAVGKDDTTSAPAPTTSKNAEPTTSKNAEPTTSKNDGATTSKNAEPTTSKDDGATTAAPTGPTTTAPTGPTTTAGAGYPKITYGMLFSFISAILLLSA